jgi:hypothetical protein
MALLQICNATVSSPGAIGTLDTSALAGDFTLVVVVNNLAAGKKARIAIEDTASATAFSDAQTVAVFDLTGGITQNNSVAFSKRAYEIPSIRVGAANNKLRANVLSVDASPNLQVQAFLVN